MSNNKQSSVEFLWQELKPWLPERYTIDDSVKVLSILKQAVEMHEKEIKRSHYEGSVIIMSKPDDDMLQLSEQYYNETFGDNNEQ